MTAYYRAQHAIGLLLLRQLDRRVPLPLRRELEELKRRRLESVVRDVVNRPNPRR